MASFSGKELILIVFILAIILINVGLFSALKKNKSGSSFQILKNSFNIVKDPFKEENQRIVELSNLVKNLEDKNSINSQNKEIE